MGFSNATFNSVHFIKIKGLEKASKQHYFELDWEKLEQTAFSWRLVKIQTSSYEFEGTERQTIKFLFIDTAQENYQLDISYNSLSRSLLNSILGFIEQNKGKSLTLNLDLSLYINKDWYKQMGIMINWDRAQWKYNIEQQKSMIETITNKKWEFVSNDYSAYDEVLKLWVDTISMFITNVDFIEEPKKVTKLINSNDEINIEDIPF